VDFQQLADFLYRQNFMIDCHWIFDALSLENWERSSLSKSGKSRAAKSALYSLAFG
jgi:hypothetical protein